MFETIVALATAPIKSALAVIRVSGDDCFAVVSKCCSKDITKIDKRTLMVAKIVDGDRVIDDVVLAIYKGPKSFTGEDLVEITCHGSILIANEIIELLISKGARYATNGEYSARAFANQKIDLIQAEAINDVINAATKEAKHLSMLSLEGETSKLVLPIKTKIADILSLIEVNIDYPEYEDIEVANKDLVIKSCNEIQESIKDLVNSAEKAIVIKDGIKVAIVGKPNVGKSSLLNALIGEEKAIVTDIAGTTRDIVEGDVSLNGLVLHLLDTAGIRESDNKVESIGIEKSKAAIEKADIVLVLLNANGEVDEEDKEILALTENSPRIIVYNKADMVSKKDDSKLYISAVNKDISKLTNEIKKRVGLDNQSFKTPALNNARQLGLLKQAYSSLSKAKEDAANDLPVDLISVSLLDAYNAILEILGEKNQNDLSKEIFSRFCVGK